MRLIPPISVMLLFSLLCGACSRSAEVRYRVSYTVDDNGISRSASGVWSSSTRPAVVPLVSRFETEFHGEAIPLTLPGRGVLLLMPLSKGTGGIYAGTMVRQMFNHLTTTDSSDLVGESAQVANMVGVSKTIRCEHYAIPQPSPEPKELITDHCLNFTFIADPKDQSTFRRIEVEEGRFADLEGVRLRSAAVTITRDPVTRGLDQLLTWLPAAEGYWAGRMVISSDHDHLLPSEIIYMRN